MKVGFTLLVKALRSNPLTALLRSRRSRFSHTKFRNCVAHSSAFTLSEVLVTLTILGIVATIVVPNLMQQYKKAQTISRLKMAYSILDNMTQQSYVENGFPPVGLQFHVTDEIFDTYFGKYLSIAKDCGMATSSAEVKDTGCFKSGNYRNTNGVSAEDKDGNKAERDMFYFMTGDDDNSGGQQPSYYYKVLLKNGMSLGIYNHRSNSSGYIMAVDIDGPNKGESKMGQDVFQFAYYAPNAGIKPAECQNVGLYPVSGVFGSSITNSQCQLERTSYLENCAEGKKGTSCAGLIIKDGWKISKDYPWDYAQKKIK